MSDTTKATMSQETYDRSVELYGESPDNVNVVIDDTLAFGTIVGADGYEFSVLDQLEARTITASTESVEEFRRVLGPESPNVTVIIDESLAFGHYLDNDGTDVDATGQLEFRAMLDGLAGLLGDVEDDDSWDDDLKEDDLY